MATDTESNETPPAILHALQAGIIDPCMIAAMAHVEGSTIGDVLEHEVKVLFGPPKEKAPPPAAPSEEDAPST